jgi:hypothetical protein
MTITSFTYSSAIPFAATVANATPSFSQDAAITCFYSPALTDITRSKLITFFTTGSAKTSDMGVKIKNEVTLTKFVNHLNSISQLDKKWETTTSELTDADFYNAFFDAVEKIDYDFTGLTVNDEIQFVFDYVATVPTGTTLPSTIVPTSSLVNVHTFKVGVSFKVTSITL